MVITDTLRIIASNIGPLKSKDDFVKIDAFEPNHLFFQTRFGNAGYFDIRQTDDGEVRLFRNARLGTPQEPPISPTELHEYLSRLLDQAQAETSASLAEAAGSRRKAAQ